MATEPPPSEIGRGPRRRTTLLLLGGTTLLGAAVTAAAVVVLVSAVLSWEGCTVTPGEVGRDPGRGTESLRLPVQVAPRADLAAGQAVLVTSTAFAPHAVVGVAVCRREADVDAAGVDACDAVQGSRFAVDAHGQLAVAYVPPRVITVGGEAFDCAAEPDACLVVAADIDDYDHSGGQAISFASGLGPADLTPVGPRPKTVRLPVLASPTGPVAAGSPVEVTAVGFVPGEPVLVARCTAEFLVRDAWEVCRTDRDDVAFQVVASGQVDAVTERADDQGVYTTVVTIPDTVEPTFGTGASCGVPESCGIVIAAAADFARSAYLPLTLA